MSMVPTCVQDPPSHGPPPQIGMSIQTSQFILSVFFLTGSETSVVPTCVQDPLSHWPPPRYESLLDQLVHSVCVVFARQWDVCVPYMCPGSPMSHWSPPQVGKSTWTSWFILSVLFLPGGEMSVVPTCVLGSPMHRDLHPGRKCLSWPAGSLCLYCFWQMVRCLWSLYVSGIPFTWTSTPVGMSNWIVGSFCLCCFSQVVRHLWSLHVTSYPHYTDLHPCRNVYLTSWFILSVLLLTDGEMSVVCTRVLDPPSHGTPPQ